MFNFTVSLRTMRDNLVSIVGAHPDNHIGTVDGKPSGSCTYAVVAEDGGVKAVCLIGKWFDSLGLLGLLLHSPDTSGLDAGMQPSQDSICEGSFLGWERLEALGITVDDDAQRYARAAQMGQDSGLYWKDALRYADARTLYTAAVEKADSLGLTYSDYPREPRMDDFNSRQEVAESAAF